MAIGTELGSMVCAMVDPERARMEVTAIRVEENIFDFEEEIRVWKSY